MTTALPNTSYATTVQQEERVIQAAVAKYKESAEKSSSAPASAGSAIFAIFDTKRTLIYARGSYDSQSKQSSCSEGRAIQYVRRCTIPEAINGAEGQALLLVTASKVGDVVPCADCVRTLGMILEGRKNSLFPADMTFLSVDAQGIVKKRTTISTLSGDEKS